jgi:NADH-quinone oxidoreductase subunit M
MNILAALAAFTVAAVVLWVVPRAFTGRRAAELGVIASIIALVELARVPIGEPETMWGEVDKPWISALHARFHVGVDEVSWPLALLTVVLTLACCLWLWRRDTSPALIALLMIIAAASLGVFVAQDLLLFFIFFELALIPMWFVIARWGDPGTSGDDARKAATKFILFTVTGSALLLVGIIVLALKADSLQIEDVRGTTSLLGAVLIAVGLAVKVPLVP